MTLFWWAQAIMLLAIIVDILAFFQKSREKLLLYFAASCLAGSIHFLLLGQYTACSLGLLALVRLLVAYLYPSNKWAALFVSIQCVIAYVTYERPVNLLAFAGSCFGTISSFQKKQRTIQYAVLLASAIWFLHNTLVWTPMGMLAEAVFFGANVVSLVRGHRNSPKAIPHPN